MSKYLDEKLHAICYRHICEKNNTHELNDEQLNEVINLKKLYIKKSSELIKNNAQELFKGIPTEKVYENALYRVAIEILAQDITDKLI